jgi:cysteine sulfinate desulfinase/cysteine desulfurase-like protein
VNLFADYGNGDDVRQAIHHAGWSAFYIHGSSVQIPLKGDGLSVATQYDCSAGKWENCSVLVRNYPSRGF